MPRYTLSLITLPLLASCVAPQLAPSGQGPVVAVPAPPRGPQTPAPPAPPALGANDRFVGDWSVADLTPGEWQRLAPATPGGAPVATFNANGQALAAIGCSNGSITLGRFGAVPVGTALGMTVRTSFALRELPVRVANDRTIYATLDARDPLWDQIIYSRGRFVVETTGMNPLLIPTRPEIARMVEDCRS